MIAIQSVVAGILFSLMMGFSASLINGKSLYELPAIERFVMGVLLRACACVAALAAYSHLSSL